jgi:P4 family phage/plasmid primase-like protien
LSPDQVKSLPNQSLLDHDGPTEIEVKDWHEYAEALADWASARIVVRRDVYGVYSPSGGQLTAKAALTTDVLVRHFRGETIGVHSTSPDNLCKTISFDVDAHGDKADPEANRKIVKRLRQKLGELGLAAIICQSNGRGGYHVRAFFRKPLQAEIARWLCEKLVSEVVAEGLPWFESFPKQDGVTNQTPYGNWLRLPGKHHKRNHWTRVWDEGSLMWLIGRDAIDRLIGTKPDDTSNVVAMYQAERATELAKKPGAGKVWNVGSRKSATRQPDKPDAATVKDALARLPNSMADAYDGDGAVDGTGWLEIGMALHSWDESQGLQLWKEFSSRCHEKYSEAACDEKWSTFSGGGGVTIGSVFYHAKQHGWVSPWAEAVATKDAILKAYSAHLATDSNGDVDHRGRPPVEPPDVDAMLARAKEFKLFSELCADADFKARLARLELSHPDQAALVRATVRDTLGTKFKPREFDKHVMASCRNQAQRDARGGDDEITLLIGETITDPHRIARKFLAEECDHPDGSTLISHRDTLYLHDGTCYQVYRDVVADLTATAKEGFDQEHEKALIQHARMAAAGKADDKPPILQQVTTGIIGNALQALRSETTLAWEQMWPCWVGTGEWDDRDPMDILPARNVLVHLPTLETRPHTPRLFTPFALSYPWIPDAPKPVRWSRFLNEELWPGDPASVRELQKWFGLCLTINTAYQKILMLIGPPRSGKGTIIRVLTALIGRPNIATPSLPGLAKQFGLWPLLDKSLCIFTDAHAMGTPSDRAIIMENLLKISGEDDVTIDIKYQSPLTTKLNARLMFVGNSSPNFRDPSGALAARLVPLQLTNSWEGKEDRNLTVTLQGELPGILRHFAIEGLEMLKEDGGFKVPRSAETLLENLKDALSPIGCFVAECVDIVDPGKQPDDQRPSVKDVFAAWRVWCDENGHSAGSVNNFGKNLHSAFPRVTDHRPRGESGDRERRYGGIALNAQGNHCLGEAQRRETMRAWSAVVRSGPHTNGGSFSRRLPVWGSSWTIPVGTCAIVGVIP